MGGDLAGSVQLAGGQRLWLFSDTQLANGRWINNSVVVQDVNGAYRTVHGGTAREPDSLVAPQKRVGEDGLARWLWPSSGFAFDDPNVPVTAHRLWVWFQEFRSTKANMDRYEREFAWVKTVLVELSLPALRVLRRFPIEDSAGEQWGAAVHRRGNEVLVYGVAGKGIALHLLVATTTASRPNTGWRYWTATKSWSSRPGDAARLLTGVSDKLTALPLPGEAGWLLVTSDLTQRTITYWSADATGPWFGPIPIHDMEMENTPSIRGPLETHNPTLIQLADTDFVLAYNMNDTLAEALAQPGIYQPRFRHLRITAR